MIKSDPLERIKIDLMRITSYETPEQLRQNSVEDYGLDYEEVLEMAYENIMHEARAILAYIESNE